MNAKKHSLGALLVAAIATLGFSSAQSTLASAQEQGDQLAVAQETVSAEADVEPVFVRNEVVQPLPAPDAMNADNIMGAANLRQLVNQVEPGAMSDQLRCLAGAVYFESRGEPLDGQLAVAQVVINRAQDRRFPASYCGVVYQRAQFSFVKGGQMPRIRKASNAWQRAKAIARIAHDELWQSKAGDAIYFHAHYVAPKWSRTKQRLAQIDTHIFYR